MKYRALKPLQLPAGPVRAHKIFNGDEMGLTPEKAAALIRIRYIVEYLGEESGAVGEPVERPGWTFTTELAGMKLLDLNNLIANHSAKLRLPAPEPFETAVEAIAYLQQDIDKE